MIEGISDKTPGSGLEAALRRRVLIGASATAVLPSALAAAVLVSAPFAGTTTTPISKVTPVRHHPAEVMSPGRISRSLPAGLRA